MEQISTSICDIDSNANFKDSVVLFPLIININSIHFYGSAETFHYILLALSVHSFYCNNFSALIYCTHFSALMDSF